MCAHFRVCVWLCVCVVVCVCVCVCVFGCVSVPRSSDIAENGRQVTQHVKTAFLNSGVEFRSVVATRFHSQ